MSVDGITTQQGSEKLHFYFAGGGTGGHIYPAIAVAQQIVKLRPDSKITFFCSERGIDSHILEDSNYEYIVLPAAGFSPSPVKLVRFIGNYYKSRQKAASVMSGDSRHSVLISVGGFVSAGPVWAAKQRNVPIVMINVDYVPGKANKYLSRCSETIFTQFEDTEKYLAGMEGKVVAAGCPLRDNFDQPDAEKAIAELGLDKNKKVLLVIGGSSGAVTVNNAVAGILNDLEAFASGWQIVHVAGTNNYQQVKAAYDGCKLECKVVDYYHNMADLYAVADLLIGRAGGVSVAEYAASGLPCVCLPYPYHKDNHQYLNLKRLIDAGAAVAVDDVPSDGAGTSRKLAEAVVPIMKDDTKRCQMAEAARKAAADHPAENIAKHIIEMVR